MRSKKINIRNAWIINPFVMYILFWLLVFILYIISPSRAKVKLNIGLILFLSVTIFVSIILSIIINSWIKKQQFIVNYKKEKYNIILLLFFSYIIEIIYSGNIPFFSSLVGKETGYQEFGLPTIHVVIITYSLLYCVKNIYQYILFQDKRNLFIGLVITTYFVLIFSRGMLILVGFCTVILYLLEKKIEIKNLFMTCLVAIVGCWIFGIAGNLRVSGQWNNSELILMLGQIEADSFSVFSPFYWVEEYIICSLRNLNYNVINLTPSYSISEFLFTLLPDFIAKRIFSDINVRTMRVITAFTTQTTYANVYSAFGYVGMVFEFVLYVLTAIILTKLKFRDGIYKLTVLSLACFIFALSIFDPMLQYSGYSFSIIWGILIGKSRVKLKFGNLKVKI